MSKGYATYRSMKDQTSAPQWNPGALTDDLSRLILLLIVLAAAGVGYKYNSHRNSPGNLLNMSVKRTLKSPFMASIEGQTSSRDTVLEKFRSRETVTPGKSVIVTSSTGTGSAPINSRKILEMVGVAAKKWELKREDMYGHPTRHFYGYVIDVNALTGQPQRYYFEYWADLRNLTAVRALLRGVGRNPEIHAPKYSTGIETYLNVRYYR